MSNDSSTTNSSWPRGSRFREHLSVISIVPNHSRVERSQFSPDSPRHPPPPPPPKSAMFSSSSNLENGNGPGASNKKQGVLMRVGSMLWNLRSWLKSKPKQPKPLHQNLNQWPPLHIEKRVCPCQDPKRKRNRRIWTIILIIILLYLIANAAVVDVRVFRTGFSDSGSGSTSGESSSGGSGAFALSSDQQSCLTQFTVNAPSSPSSYPCGQCLPALQGVPSSFSQTNPQDFQNIQNAVQFCGLKSIFDDANSAGQSVLGNGSWVQNVKFCSWAGVQCDGSGLVSSIQLTFPAVPASVPSQVGALTDLQSFQIVGNGALPGGSLPSSFTNLTAMTILHFESTAISALPDNLFSSLSKMQSLTLIKNSQFGGALPSTVTGTSLHTLVVNNQAVSTPLSTLFSSSSLQSSLSFLDLSATGLSTSIPSTISSFKSLVELHLDDNNLQSPLSSFPSSLQIITLSNNTALSGPLPASLCSSSSLTTCDLSNTGFGNGSSCGHCTF